MAGKHVVEVAVLADTKQFGRAMGELGKATGLGKLASAGKAAVGAIAKVGAGLGLAAGAGAAKAVQSASSLEQSIGGLDAVFKQNAGKMHAWAKGAADSVGLTRNEFNELSVVLGSQLKNGGLSMDKVADKTNDLVKVGADLSAMFGGSTADAVGALSSALKGERDPIERYGVSLKQSAIDAKAAELGYKKVGGSLTDQAQQAATLALIMEQTKDAQGAFGRESNTLAGITQRLKAKLSDLGGKIGTALLPYVSKVADVVLRNFDPAMAAAGRVLERDVLPRVRDLATWARDHLLPALRTMGEQVQTRLIPALVAAGQWIGGTLVPALIAAATWIRNNAAWIMPLVVAISTLVAGWIAYTRALMIWQAITKTAAAVQAAFNLVMAANPIALVIIAILALVAAIVYAWKNNETFRRVVLKVWEAVSGAVIAAGRWIADTCRSIGSSVAGAWRSISSWFGQLPGKFREWFGGARDAVSTQLGAAVDWLAGLPGRILGAVGNLRNLLYSAGADIVRGLMRGLDDMVGAAMDKARNLASSLGDAAKRALGIRSPSRLFRGIGKDTGAGLVLGLKDTGRAVQRAAGGMVDHLTTGAATITPTLTARPTLAAAGAPIVLNVQMLDPTPAAARLIVDMIRDAQRTGALRA